MTREQVHAAILSWAKEMLSDYDVSKDAYECDPELPASVDALLDYLGVEDMR